jgi:hypothetical protein
MPHVGVIGDGLIAVGEKDDQSVKRGFPPWRGRANGDKVSGSLHWNKALRRVRMAFEHMDVPGWFRRLAQEEGHVECSLQAIVLQRGGKLLSLSIVTNGHQHLPELGKRLAS